MNNSNTLSSIELSDILNTSHEYTIGMIYDMLSKLYDDNIPSELLGETIDLDYGHLLAFIYDLEGDIKQTLLKICKELKEGNINTSVNIEKIVDKSVQFITVRFDENTVCDFMRIDGIWFMSTDEGYELIDGDYAFNLDMLEALYMGIQPDAW